ncbi:hypothetical protein ACQJBY_026706 [Aegilops geniculata]
MCSLPQPRMWSMYIAWRNRAARRRLLSRSTLFFPCVILPERSDECMALPDPPPPPCSASAPAPGVAAIHTSLASAEWFMPLPPPPAGGPAGAALSAQPVLLLRPPPAALIPDPDPVSPPRCRASAGASPGFVPDTPQEELRAPPPPAASADPVQPLASLGVHEGALPSAAAGIQVREHPAASSSIQDVAPGRLALICPPAAPEPSLPAAGTGAGREEEVAGGWQQVKSRHGPRRPAVADQAFKPPPLPAWLKGRCCRCLAPGHKAAFCRDPFRCSRCPENGHRARGCRNKWKPLSALACLVVPLPLPRPTPDNNQAASPRFGPGRGWPLPQTAPPPLRVDRNAMPRLGDASARPTEDFVVVPATPEMQAEAELLSSNAAMVWLEGVRDDTRYLALWAWTASPNAIPKVKWLTQPAHGHRRRGRRGLRHRALIHLDLLEDHTKARDDEDNPPPLDVSEFTWYRHVVDGAPAPHDRRGGQGGQRHDARRPDRRDDDDDNGGRRGRGDDRPRDGWRDRVRRSLSRNPCDRQRDDRQDRTRERSGGRRHAATPLHR